MFNEETLKILEDLKSGVDKALVDLSKESLDSLEEGIKKFEKNLIDIENKALEMIKNINCSEQEKIKIMEFINNPNLKSQDWNEFKKDKKENLPGE